MSSTTSDVSLITGAGFIYGLIVITDGTNDCVVTLYDNTEASGTNILGQAWTTTGSDYQSEFTGINIPFTTGVYVDVTTSGTCNVIVMWGRLSSS
ncbi:MAG: hypothetical protein ACTSX6_09550 [Candidatus Heimdallarchaeaceae archaeon]